MNQRIRTTILATVSLCFLFAPTLLAQEGVSARLDAAAMEAVKEDPAPGMSILVQSGDLPLLSKGFGMADVENDIAMTEESVHRIGSITKQFTSAAIMRLVEQDKLTLETTLGEVLDDYDGPGKVATVHQLLNHTSGIPSYTGLGAAFWSKATMNMSHEEMLDLFKDMDLEFEPGAEQQYNNSGYYLLGMIIEEITGDTYEDHLKTEFLEPLGLDKTLYCRTRYLIPNRAEGYEMNDGELINDTPIGMNSPYAAGALCSTTGDLGKWTKALHSGQVVSQESFAKMIAPTEMPDGSTMPYGYGLSFGEDRGHRFISHGGGINGFSTMLAYHPDDDLIVAVLGNSGGANSTKVARDLARIALGAEVDPIERAELTDEQLMRYPGTYQAGQMRITISVEDGKLMGQPDGQGALELAPRSETEFHVEEVDGKVVFEFGEDGKAARFTLHQGGSATVAERIEAGAEVAEKEMPETVEVPEETLETYVGDYEMNPNFVITVTRNGSQLSAQATGQDAFPIYASDMDSFYYTIVEASIDFEKNDQGTVTGLVLNQGGQNMPARKVK